MKQMKFLESVVLGKWISAPDFQNLEVGTYCIQRYTRLLTKQVRPADPKESTIDHSLAVLHELHSTHHLQHRFSRAVLQPNDIHSVPSVTMEVNLVDQSDISKLSVVLCLCSYNK